MTNPLSLHILALANRYARDGKISASDPSASRRVWADLAAQIAAELETRQLAAAAREILASAPKARAALADENFGPVRDALEKIAAKTPVPSSLRSADWAAFPVAVREASQFSAGIESARVMSAIQERLTSEAGWDFRQPKGREAFIRDMRAVMESEGVGWESAGEGSLVNPRANSRLGLIYDQQTRSARGYAARKISMDPDVLSEVPAQELVREGAAKVARDWPRRWREAGGRLVSGRMAALKTAPIWTAISRFGVPWPPFDYGSHMGLLDILRTEAEAIGLVKPGEILKPEPVPDYAAGISAGAESLTPEALGWLRAAYGKRLELADGALRLLPKKGGA